MRATICTEVGVADEETAVDRWFARWKTSLTYLSKDRGCGCCVHLFDVDGPEEAIQELPDQVRACSPWTRGEG